MSGLLDLFFGRRRNRMPDEYRAALRKIRQNRSKLYRNVRMAVILVTVLAVVFLALAIFVPDLRHPVSFKLTFSVLAICLGGAACLPWITQLDRDKRRKAKGENLGKARFAVAYAFFVFIALCTVLWIISVFVISDHVIGSVINGEGDIPPTTFTFLRVSIIFSLQALFGSVIATGILRHGKNYLVLRVIMYIAIAYLDIWLSWVAGGITVAGITNMTFLPISNTILWVLAVMTGVALLVSASILAGQKRRKEIELVMKGDVAALTEGDVDLIDTQATTASMYRPDTPPYAPQGQQMYAPPQPVAPPRPVPPPAPTASAAEKLRELKQLRDDGIITEQEYQAKRQKIIDSM